MYLVSKSRRTEGPPVILYTGIKSLGREVEVGFRQFSIEGVSRVKESEEK